MIKNTYFLHSSKKTAEGELSEASSFLDQTLDNNHTFKDKNGDREENHGRGLCNLQIKQINTNNKTDAREPLCLCCPAALWYLIRLFRGQS